MDKRIPALVGATAALLTGIGQAGAQQTSAGAAMQEGPRDRKMQQGASEQMGPGRRGEGMVGEGMAGAGMMGPSMMDQYMRGHRRGHMGALMGHGAMMPFLFGIMDADGDGALTLEEVQETHVRIFRHLDADDDGKVTQEEIRAFLHRGQDASASAK